MPLCCRCSLLHSPFTFYPSQLLSFLSSLSLFLVFFFFPYSPLPLQLQPVDRLVERMPMPCRFSEEHPDEICLCSACHLSSELFPRRQDGKIVLPGLPASRDSPSLRAECPPPTAQTEAQESVQGVYRLPPAPIGPNQLPPVSPPIQATSPITAERANRPRVRSHTRTNGSGTSFGRFKNAGAGTDGPSGIPEFSTGSSSHSSRAEPRSRSPNNRSRPRSRSQSYHTTTTAVSNPYPMPVDTSYPRPSGKSPLVDNRTQASVPESTSSASVSPPPLPSTSNSVNTSTSTTPALKFCPPFVASDRIALPPSSDAAKEGVTMIPWSARRRKQKYRSGFDSGTGQGKSKTMFRYYGPDNPDSDTTKR